MKYIFLFLLTIKFFQCSAQAPDWAWAQSLESNPGVNDANGPFINGIAVDDSNNIYVTGSFFDTLELGNISLISYGGTDIFLAKYSANGVLQWATHAGGISSADAGYGICFDKYDNLYICGSFGDTAQFDNFYLNSVGQNMFVAIYNPVTGKCENVRKIGSTENYSFFQDTANSGILYKIFVDISGNIYLNGATNAPYMAVVDLGGQSITGNFVVKYDQYYNLVWVNTLYSNYSTSFYGFLVDSLGNVFSTAPFDDEVDCDYDIIYTDGNTNNGYLVSYNDSDGNLNWLKSIGGNSIYPYSCSSNNGSYIYLNGSFIDSCIFDSLLFFKQINGGYYGYYSFLAKYDWSGNAIWSKMFNSLVTTSVDDMIGNTVSCGNFVDTLQIGNDTISALGNNLFVVKLDGNGNLLWSKYDSVSTVSYLSVEPYLSAMDKSGNVIIAGVYPSSDVGKVKDTLNFVLGEDTLKAKYPFGGNLFLAKLGNAPTGISLPTLPEAGVKLFPNPGDGQFTVDITKPYYLSNVQVYNIVGQECNVIVNYSSDKLQATITMNNAAAGVYTVILSSGSSKVAKLFIKQ